MDYETKPTSRVDLRRYSVYFRKLFDVPKTGPFPVLEALDKISEVFEGSNYIIVEDAQLPPQTMAQCSPNDLGGFTIEIKESVYVTLSPEGNPKYISYYDKENKRRKQIDLDKPHRGVSPHTHHGYKHNENDSAKGFAQLTPQEKDMVSRINRVWREKKNVAWSRWKKHK